MRAITFDKGATDFIFQAFYLFTGPDGFIRDARGFHLKALDGKSITKDEFAGIVKTDEGMKAVRKGFMGALDLLAHEERRDGCVPPKPQGENK